MRKYEWILCPICGSKARGKICDDTIIENLPLNISVIKELDPKMQSR